MGLRYGSVCSGIESASVAWHPLGWEAAWFAEIEPFPCSVLAHHYPDVPNLGDMTKIAQRVLAGEVEAPDVLVGGTPCQAFSVAGMREGLNDQRGQLTIKFMELANAIDHVRARAGKQPCIIVWENVPGVYSDKTNAFGCFLAGLAGEDDELRAPGGKWAHAGAVYGPQRAIAWRTLDAQYFALAQRRRRCFLVASARAGFDPATVLFEWEGVRRDTAPSREAGQGAATGTLRGTDGGIDIDHAAAGHVLPVAFGGNNTAGSIDVATACNASASASGRMDFESETFVVQSVALRGRDGGATAELGGDLANALRCGGGGGDKPHVLAPIAFDCKASGQSGFGVGEIASTMRAMGHADSHQNGGGHLAVCITGEVTHTLKAEGFDASEDGTGRGQPIVAAIHENQRAELTMSDTAGTIKCGGGKPGQGYPAVMAGMAVRRLTPVECERLMGFPDQYTNVPHRGKPAADGNRYKALGNSMARPCMTWIGQRIELAEGRMAQKLAA